MTINFSAKQRQYETHKEAIDKLLLESITREKATCTENSARLERDLAAYLGTAKEPIVCNTQFNAFVLLFKLLELKAGDEVITSPLASGIAVQAALFMGAKVIFVDVNEDDLTVDIEQVEDAVTERTKLIIPVSLFGRCADMESINTIAQQHDLCVIEDAAESFGTRRNGQLSCQLSKLATTSFFSGMPLDGFGNGAALFIDDDELRSRAKILRSQGRAEGDYLSVGVEACMDEIQASVIDYKLSLFDDEIAARRTLAQRYDAALKDSGLELLHPGEESNYAFYPIRTPEREAVAERLKRHGIETKVPFRKPLHLEEAFAFMRYSAGDFPVSEKMTQTLLLLPLNAYLTTEEQESIIAALLQH